jgi:hypothetical protein
MKNLKTNRVIALKQVGINKKEVESYRKSSREYFVQYRGRESNVVTQELLSKVKILADVRRNMGVEIAGVLFEDNLNVTFIFYINDDPKDAFYERNCFLNVSDFEQEIDRQIAPNFIPDMDQQKHVICKYGHELEIYSLNE